MEQLIDEYKYLVGGYYGIQEMDEYDLKVYLLKEIENYIRNFIQENKILDFDYKKEAELVKDTYPLITKLQDSLLILPRIDAPLEIILLVKKRIKLLKEE